VVARDLDHSTKQFGPQPMFLIPIGHQDGNFPLAPCVKFDQSTHPQDVMLPRQFVFEVHDKSRLAMAINLTNANQALMRHTGSQAERAKVTRVNRAVGQCFMELFHQRFVIRTDWSKRVSPHGMRTI